MRKLRGENQILIQVGILIPWYWFSTRKWELKLYKKSQDISTLLSCMHQDVFLRLLSGWEWMNSIRVCCWSFGKDICIFISFNYNLVRIFEYKILFLYSPNPVAYSRAINVHKPKYCHIYRFSNFCSLTVPGQNIVCVICIRIVC